MVKQRRLAQGFLGRIAHGQPRFSRSFTVKPFFSRGENGLFSPYQFHPWIEIEFTLGRKATECTTGLAFSPPASQHGRITFHGVPCMSLSDAARKVRENAYAPYSNFKVGAALRAPSGQIYSGCNVENVAYPEGTCAEAGAIAAMIAAGETEILEAYVIADSPSPVPPCGGCRQKLAEFAKGEVKVTLATTDGTEQVMKVADLLPGAFGASHMENS
ncbi:MAG: cytidine deaminase [Pelagimonas sp.]|jgi:cytidine deaminase|nr:cytidine deaminase [Pelagimonas sp.]